jgi:esterase/lipase superfamily enzyme
MRQAQNERLELARAIFLFDYRFSVFRFLFREGGTKPMYWMITNRNVKEDGFGDEFSDLSYWKNETNQLELFDNWKRLEAADFRQGLVKITDDTFPHPLNVPAEDQQHVNLFVHGYDNGWVSAVRRYGQIVGRLFSGVQSLGECILFTWPSEGSPIGYLPDRSEARKSAEDFAIVLSALYDWMSMKQAAAAKNPADACKAKTSVIAHSMGNYVVENAMNFAWTRQNRPLLMSLINQFVMVAADVDNDIFRAGEAVQHGDGEGIANLTYRATAMYSGRDSVLGMSAGLKHFGKRRLGRSGLDRTAPLPDNVWDIDCSNLIDPKLNGIQVHGAYFESEPCYDLMRQLLRGIDRSVLFGTGLMPEALPKLQPGG